MGGSIGNGWAGTTDEMLGLREGRIGGGLGGILGGFWGILGVNS